MKELGYSFPGSRIGGSNLSLEGSKSSLSGSKPNLGGSRPSISESGTWRSMKKKMSTTFKIEEKLDSDEDSDT